jgi:hypothetical protein
LDKDGSMDSGNNINKSIATEEEDIQEIENKPLIKAKEEEVI